MRVRKLESNVPGNFYVTTACINCDTCRQLAPEVFTEVGDYSAVAKQPMNPEESVKAFYALLACPTGAIGSVSKQGQTEAMQDFPLCLEDNVYYCGFTSRKSFGGSSYFIQDSAGNWLIDSPRYVPALVHKFAEMGGIRYIFLTHRDDVADADRYASHFGAERLIHALEKGAQPDAEHLIQGMEPINWSEDFRILPVPGHTQGHIALLYRNRFLFTGDHLAWDRTLKGLEANRDYCWYSWQQQTQSMERLLHEKFEWILPGHGERIQLSQAEMKQAMQRLIQEMRGCR